MEDLCLNIEQLLAIENHMTIFFEVSNIPAVFMDRDGVEVFSNIKKEKFCLRFEKVDSVEKTCEMFHHQSGKQSAQIKETYISFCPAGLVHFSSALHISDVYIGTIVAGPVLFDLPDSFLLRQIMEQRKIDVKNMSFLEMYYGQIPVVNVEKGRRIKELLDILVNDVEKDLSVISVNDVESDDHEWDEINFIPDDEKVQETKLNMQEEYPINLEKELIQNIKHTNVMGVRKCINEILGYIYLRTDMSHKKISIIVLELVVLMTRAAIDIGADFDDMTKLISEYIEAVSRLNTQDDSYELVYNFLNRFMAIVFTKSNHSNSEKEIVQKIVSYIQNNYNTGITLDEVANYVGMNISYMSRFFKKHVGMNFNDYVNSFRVEYSKEYLENQRYSIIDVALMMGFTDQSYYSKVFKKYTGVTPGKYRKMVK